MTKEEKMEIRRDKKSWNEMLRRLRRKEAVLSNELNGSALYAIEGDINAGAAAAREHQSQAADLITNYQHKRANMKIDPGTKTEEATDDVKQEEGSGEQSGSSESEEGSSSEGEGAE